jgi:hypothetical protein
MKEGARQAGAIQPVQRREVVRPPFTTLTSRLAFGELPLKGGHAEILAGGAASVPSANTVLLAGHYFAVFRRSHRNPHVAFARGE